MKKGRINWLKCFVLDAHLKSKLLCVYFLLIILPLGFFTLFTYHKVSAVIQEQTFTAAKKTFEDVSLGTETAMAKLDSVLDALSHDSLIYHMASTNPQDYPLLQQLENTNQLSVSFVHLKNISGVDNIRLYVNNDFIYSHENRNIFSMTDAKNSNWYQKLTDSGQCNMWFAPDDFADQPKQDRVLFSSMRIIYNPISVSEPLAILRVDMQSECLAKIIDATPVTENGMILLMKDENILLYSGKDELHSLSPSLYSRLKEIKQNEWDTVLINGKKNYVNYKSFSPSGWYMATVIPYDDIYSVSRTLRAEMIIAMFAIGVIAYLLAYAISNSFIKRIASLTKTMHDIESGNVTAQIEPIGGDEIGQLMTSFNNMMEQINTLMDEKYEYGQEIKNLELKALQAQINPHFLYNSLDLINCMAIQKNVPEITIMVNSLAKFYKLSLNRGKDIIPISDELTHANVYIQIQNMRFENRIQVEWDIQKEIEDYKIIKIILQPIIENAIIHGIFETGERFGILKISGWKEDGDIFITVADNGIGMNEECIRENFTPTQSGNMAETKGGYGIHNINDRIRLAYGGNYGLSCKSEPGKGTLVTIHIPAIMQKQNT